jgi:hypothetical protein
MIAFFLSIDNLPFTISLITMLAISFLEGISLIIGISFFGIFEMLFPSHADADKRQGSMSESTSKSWALIPRGKVPFIVIVVIFLSSFSLAGFFMQYVAKSLSGQYIRWFYAIWPPFIIAMLCVSFVTVILSKVHLKNIESSYAVRENTFVGKVAIITIGTAKKGQPAEAKLRDQYGKTHYVMVEPDGREDQFERSTQVLLVRKEKSIFKAIENPSKALNNKDIE